MAKKTVSITLHMSEVIYDVQNKTYLTGRSRYAGNNPEEVANMQNNDDEENKNEVLRSIGNAFATLKTKLSEYINEEKTSASNALIKEGVDLVVALTMPSNYNTATVDTVAAAMHQYLLNSAIAAWFTITDKNDASDYVTLAAANIEQIREAINKRVRPTRPEIADDTQEDQDGGTEVPA